ncbi:MAG: hypothetical protein JWM46_123 [Candidatus Kaiserbacteria bacterium]|nr:hypothetical protein [Candidatus Kaiserbacteria bacterium]
MPAGPDTTNVAHIDPPKSAETAPASTMMSSINIPGEPLQLELPIVDNDDRERIDM